MIAAPLTAGATREPLDVEVALERCERVRRRLAGVSPAPWVDRLSARLERAALEDRMRDELGDGRPFDLARPELARPVFTGWAPLGTVVHRLPTEPEAPLDVVAGALVETLLTGSHLVVLADAGPAARRLAEIVEAWDGDVTWLPRAADSEDEDGDLLATADAVFAWSDACGASSRDLLPATTPLHVATRREHVVVATVPLDCATRTGVLADVDRALASAGCGRVLCRLADADDRDLLHHAFAEAVVDGSLEIADELELVGRHHDAATATLVCPSHELGVWSRRLALAGIESITAPGGFDPAALRPRLDRFVRRVVVAPGALAGDLARLAEQLPQPPAPRLDAPVLTKDDFQAQAGGSAGESRAAASQLYVKSGGSSAAPVLSGFTYRDYDEQMRAMAEGLLATGVDPGRDRCANFFYCGNLYGGFLSVFTILEHLGAVQFPFAGIPDFDVVSRVVLRHRTNALFGTPSYILQLLGSHLDRFQADPVVDKIFYAGEPMRESQSRWLRDELGIEIVRSACYGSNDSGPMGFACTACRGGEHHLLTQAQHLEILELDADRPVAPGAVGRLVFTSKLRRAQPVIRYEIGDLGRWVEGPCPCGRRQPRFELLGRIGDTFKMAGVFFNVRKLAHVLDKRLGYDGLLQIRLDTRGRRDRMMLRLESTPDGRPSIDVDEARRWLLQDDDDFRHAAGALDLIDVDFESLPAADFERNARSGKLPTLLDLR